MIPKACRRLAEADFPIAVVSRHAAREKSIRHGHPSTLHLWWARRPLASCRAVLLALLWPDPCDPLCPEAFKRAARAHLPEAGCNIGTSDLDLRRALLKFIGDFADWNHAAKPTYLGISRALVAAAHGEEPPLVVDPFAGGGSIPLEALRVGCEAFASDLNPVACLILKVMLEDIPRHGQALAEKLRRTGAEIKKEAERELAAVYPKDADGATPIAFLWARTVRCEAPDCGAEIPLVRSFWLCRKKNRLCALRYKALGRPSPCPLPEGERKSWDPIPLGEGRMRVAVAGGPRVKFEIFTPETEKDVPAGTVARAKARCPCCGVVLSPDRVRAQLAAQRGGADVVFDAEGRRVSGAMLLAVVTLRPGETGRHYRLPAAQDYAAVREAAMRLEALLEAWERNGRQGLCPVPDEKLPPVGTLGFRVQRYGMLQWGDLFTARQKLALASLARLVASEQHGDGGRDRRCMAMALGRCGEQSSSLVRWRTSVEAVAGTFGRQALPMMWDFTEIVPTGDLASNFSAAVDWVAEVAEQGWKASPGQIESADAAQHPLPDDTATVWFTDPPYYDAVPYADLSDFFHCLAQASTSRDPNAAGSVRSHKCALAKATGNRPGRDQARRESAEGSRVVRGKDGESLC